MLLKFRALIKNDMVGSIKKMFIFLQTISQVRVVSYTIRIHLISRGRIFLLFLFCNISTETTEIFKTR